MLGESAFQSENDWGILGVSSNTLSELLNWYIC